jgi:hypothetical protein
LAATRLPLELGGVAEGRTARDELVNQIDDYALPRLTQIDAPLLAVLGGSTGAGKSTITNSIIGADVSTAGVLRPTTRTPVLVCHPNDEAWFMDGGVLPGLPRSTGERPTGAGVHIVTSPAIPEGFGLLDSPDIDSIEVANHELAGQLLGAADLWLFCTTAARYADAVPWEYLARAQERAIALSVIVNRIPPGAETEVGDHIAEMLAQRGLADTRLFLIAEGPLTDGRMTEQVAPIRSWLDGLVADTDARNELIRQTISGVLDSVPARVHRLGEALAGQGAGAEALQSVAETRYQRALTEIERGLDSGNLLQGEVLDAWREHVGTADWMDRMQRSVGRFRNRVTSIFSGRAQPEAAVQGQLESNLALLIREAADAAALDTVEAWDALPGGRHLLDQSARGLDRSTDELRGRISTEIEQWQRGVIDLMSEQAGAKMAAARALSLGVNGLGVTLMIAVFSQTGGVTGGEAAIAGGTAAVSQAVLSAIFGDQAVRDLARTARDDLRHRIGSLLIVERERFDALIDGVPGQEEIASLGASLELLAEARR